MAVINTSMKIFCEGDRQFVPEAPSLSRRRQEPSWSLAFSLCGKLHVRKDLEYYTKTLGARKIWDFTSMGTRVAAVNVSSGPLLLLAGHRPAPSVLPVFEVENLKATVKELRNRGWRPDGGEFEIPNGPCYLFKDPSGNQMAIFQDVRPRLLESGFRETG